MNLEEKLGLILNEYNLTISCAESCSGGLIAHKLSKHPGSSNFFVGSVTAYQNRIKEHVLGVKKESLVEFGAVSKSVVEQMAIGVKNLMKTDIAIATSGVAGPTGGSKDKPVGTIWIAWAGEFGVKSSVFNFMGNRQENIEETTHQAIKQLISIIT